MMEIWHMVFEGGDAQYVAASDIAGAASAANGPDVIISAARVPLKAVATALNAASKARTETPSERGVCSDAPGQAPRGEGGG